MKMHHSLLYVIEFAILGGGFAFLLVFNPPIYNQFLVLTVILFIYMFVGLAHHQTHKDIHIKVVLEYILVSAIVFALFVFLNISRL